MRRFLTSAFVSLLAACGGSGTGPSPTVGITLVRATPAPGGTITLSPSGADMTARVSMTFSVVSDKDIPHPTATVAWNAGGEYCAASSFNALSAVKANEPQTFTLDRLVWRTNDGGSFVCPLPTTTSLIAVEVEDFCFCNNPATFYRELSISYTFVAGS